MAEETFINSEYLKPIEIMQNQEILNSLRNLSLNQYEAQAYLALGIAGNCTAGEVAEIGKIARPRVYDVLEKLQEKGFVAVKAGRPVRYTAIPLPEAVETLKKYKQNRLLEEIGAIEKISKELAKKISSKRTTKKFQIEENVWTLKGRNSIYSRIAEMVAKSKEHIIVNSHPEGVIQKIKENVKHFEEAKQRGVKIHVVSSLEDLDKRTSINSANSTVQKIAHAIIDKKIPTRMVVADDEAIIFLTKEETPADDEVGLWVKSPHLAQTFKEILK